MIELREFLQFLKSYFKERAINFGHNFEKLKDIIVAFLIVKRGKYSSSFLNTSFIILIVTAFIGGPIIAENNPFTSSFQESGATAQGTVLSFDPFESAVGTVVSVKPRDKIIDYEVRGGDTLASIAQKFDVSVDTLKWTNDMKGTTIKPGQIVKVPPVTGVVHKVNSGESIYSIAKKYRTNAQKIVNFPFNDFADFETFALTPGQTLIVPDGVVEDVVPTAPQFASIKAGVRGSSAFIWPTSGNISQYPVGYHMAVDIESRGAPPIIASDTGTVTYAGCIGYGYGCHIIIDHANGYQTLYGHLSSITAGAGQGVSKGQQIGIMGSTGRSTGTHLHFEVRQGGALLNPLSFLK